VLDDFFARPKSNGQIIIRPTTTTTKDPPIISISISISISVAEALEAPACFESVPTKTEGLQVRARDDGALLVC
jgi:hypothetical protein